MDTKAQRPYSQIFIPTECETGIGDAHKEYKQTFLNQDTLPLSATPQHKCTFFFTSNTQPLISLKFLSIGLGLSKYKESTLEKEPWILQTSGPSHPPQTNTSTFDKKIISNKEGAFPLSAWNHSIIHN